MSGDVKYKIVELLFGGELAVDEQVGYFQEAGFLGQLFDGVTSIVKNPGLAVDEGDFALTGSCVQESLIHGDGAGGAPQFGNIYGFFVFGSGDYRYFQFLAFINYLCCF